MPIVPAKPERIHIIGGPGSGKTTLARQLAAQLSLPFYELDLLGYVGGSGPQYPLEKRLAEVERIAGEAGWVSEGIFLGWTARLFEAADVIVWLDLPWRIAARRIILRHIRADLVRNNRHPGYRKLAAFLDWAGDYYRSKQEVATIYTNPDAETNRLTAQLYLKPYWGKVIHCRYPAEVAACQTRLAV